MQWLRITTAAIAICCWSTNYWSCLLIAVIRGLFNVQTVGSSSWGKVTKLLTNGCQQTTTSHQLAVWASQWGCDVFLDPVLTWSDCMAVLMSSGSTAWHAGDTSEVCASRGYQVAQGTISPLQLRRKKSWLAAPSSTVRTALQVPVLPENWIIHEML